MSGGAKINSSVALLDEGSLCASICGLPSNQVRELVEFARDRREPLIQVLIERGNVEEGALLKGLAERLDIPFLDEAPDSIAPEILSHLSPVLTISNHLMPIGEENGRLQVACSDPFDWQKWDELTQIVGKPMDRVLCPRPVIARMLKAHYGLGADTVQRLIAGRGEESKDLQLSTPASTNLSEEEAANEPTVVNLVNRVLTEAIQANATDIHMEPYENKYRVRYRVDGELEDVSVPNSVKLLRAAIVSRIKIMASLDITEKRLPQDGRCQVSLGGQEYDLRVSILPGTYGEAVNIRLQSRQMVKLDLASLGFEPGDRAKISKLITHPHGLVLVTGPTGSGKTTTLYTCLSQINTPDTKIITIEDPVEYRMEDVLQMQVHDEIGFTFARALRSMLRHDPDVMLVGEIRDRETADIAIRSSLTGHLVFATLHTNDAASAFTRLLDIGIEPFLVASSVLGVIAQRLVRKLCPHCKRQITVNDLDDVDRESLKSSLSPDAKIWQAGKCDRCRFTGYRGRTVISEVLPVTADVRRLIQQREPAERINEMGCEEGMRTLRQSALVALNAGIADFLEVTRTTLEDK